MRSAVRLSHACCDQRPGVRADRPQITLRGIVQALSDRQRPVREDKGKHQRAAADACKQRQPAIGETGKIGWVRIVRSHEVPKEEREACRRSGEHRQAHGDAAHDHERGGHRGKRRKAGSARQKQEVADPGRGKGGGSAFDEAGTGGDSVGTGGE
ncbi:hypothetical protein ACVJBD_003219 [Rhizobium mongolense]